MVRKLFMFLSVIAAMTFMSCSSSSTELYEENVTNEVSNNVDENYLELHDEIVVLNSKLAQHESRGFFSRLFKRVLNVFVSDVIGAVRGVINGDNIWQSAQGSSLVSAKKQGFITAVDLSNEFIGNAPRRIVEVDDTLVTSRIQPKDFALHDIILGDSVSWTVNDSIGFYHNLLIYNLLEKNNSVNYWKSVSDDACVLMLNEEIINTIPLKTYNDIDVSGSTLHFCSFIGDESLKCDNYKELITVTKSKYPDLKKVLDITSLYFDGMELVSTDEEWKQYCKDLIELISNSKLDACEKDALKSGIAVGYASSKLWKCE